MTEFESFLKQLVPREGDAWLSKSKSNCILLQHGVGKQVIIELLRVVLVLSWVVK